MNVWVVTEGWDHEGASVLGVTRDEQAGKNMAEADAHSDQLLRRDTRRIDLEWKWTPSHPHGGWFARGRGDRYYEVTPWEVAGGE